MPIGFNEQIPYPEFINRILGKSTEEIIDAICEYLKTQYRAATENIEERALDFTEIEHLVKRYAFFLMGNQGIDNGEYNSSGVITADQILANAITVGEVDFDSQLFTDGIAKTDVEAWRKSGAVTYIDGAKIYTGSITADQIAAGTITAEKLDIATITDNMVLNPSFEHEGGWALMQGSGTATYSTADKTEGSYSFLIPTPLSSWGCLAIPLVPGDKYAIRIKIKGTSATGSGLYVLMNEKDSYPSGGYVSATLKDSETYFVTDGAIPNTWTTYEYTYTVPAGVYWGSFTVNNWTGGAAGGIYIDEAEVRKQLAGVHIEDGTITAAKIVAGTITADEIHAGTITADNLEPGLKTYWYSTPSATDRNSNNAATSTLSTTYTKKKEIRVDEDTGKMRIYFEMKSLAGDRVYARIYIGGVAIGTERSTLSTSYVDYSQDLGPYVDTNLIQIYAKATDGERVYVQNFRLQYDRAVSIACGEVLISPLVTDDQTPFSVTNDP